MFYSNVIKIIGMFLFISAAGLYAQGNQDTTKNLQKAYMEYQQISQRLQSVQQQALADSILAEKGKNFGKKLDLAMIKENPSIKEKIEKRDKIINNFEEAQQKGDNEKLMKLQEDYKSIVQELQVHQQKAMENEKLKNEGKELNDEIVQKMTKIDPQVPQLIARLEVLGKQLQQGMH
jgi:hypothetical protein